MSESPSVEGAMLKPITPSASPSQYTHYIHLLTWAVPVSVLAALLLFIFVSIRAQNEVEATLTRLESLAPGIPLDDVEHVLASAAMTRQIGDVWQYVYRLHGSTQPFELRVNAPQQQVQSMTLWFKGAGVVPLGDWHRYADRVPARDALSGSALLAMPLVVVFAGRLLLRHRPIWTPRAAFYTCGVQLFWGLAMLMKLRFGD